MHRAFPTDLPIEDVTDVIQYLEGAGGTPASVAANVWWILGYGAGMLTSMLPAPTPAPPVVTALPPDQLKAQLLPLLKEMKAKHASPGFVIPWATLLGLLLQLLSGLVVKPQGP